MFIFQKLAVLILLFAFISNTLVKTLYDKVYYNLHNELWISILYFFLLHANIKAAFTDYDNHSETDFYELKKKKSGTPFSVLMGTRPCVKTLSSRCACAQVSQ